MFDLFFLFKSSGSCLELLKKQKHFTVVFRVSAYCQNFSTILSDCLILFYSEAFE